MGRVAVRSRHGLTPRGKIRVIYIFIHHQMVATHTQSKKKHEIIKVNTRTHAHGVRLIVTILRQQRPWRRCALY